MIGKKIRTTAVVKSDYEKNSKNYDRVRFGTPGGRYVDKKEQEFVASIIKGSNVMEVGTATGRFAASLTQHGAAYTGVDLSQKMIAIDNRSDGNKYDVSMEAIAPSVLRQIREGGDVSVSAVFDGTRYSARSVDLAAAHVPQ